MKAKTKPEKDKVKDYSSYPFMNLSLRDMKGEKWKDIPSFDGYFMVSNYGRVWALPRPIQSTTGQSYFTKEHIKKQYLGKYHNTYTKDYNEQLSVHIRYERKSYTFKVTRLVYDLFVKPLKNFKNDRLLVVHKDGDNCNNRADNLVLMNGTQLYRHGLEIKHRPRSGRKIRKRNPLVWSDKNSPRPVIKYTLDGKKVQEYESVAHAAQVNQVGRTNLRHVIYKRLKQLHGFVYRFRGDKYRGEYADFSITKTVTQYALDGKKIAVYPSVKQASIETGIDADTISKCALHKTKLASGYVWRYQNDTYHGEYKNKIKNKAKPIVQYSLEGKKITSYSSLSEASLKTGFTVSTLLQCARKRSKVSHGFVWRFEGESYNGEYKHYRIGEPVTQHTIDGKRLMTYPTIAIASKATCVTHSNIQKNVSGENKTAGGFVWKYATPKEILSINLQHTFQYQKHENYSGKEVIQYSLEGHKLAQYSSIAEAARACKANANNIAFVIDKPGRSAAGFVWRTKGNRYHGALARNPLPNKARTVTQYDLKGKRIKVFKSAKQAERITGIASSTISDVANNKLKTAGGFIWQYGDGPIKINISKYNASTVERLKRMSKPVIKYSLEGKRILEYPSIGAAARAEGISGSRISSVVNGNSLSASGYFWKLKKNG